MTSRDRAATLRLALCATLVVSGCGSGRTAVSEPAIANPGRASGAPRADVLKTLCESGFGQGDMASVGVFRTTAGTVAVLVLRPDINHFTHAPSTYYGPDGTPLVVVADRPVTAEELKNNPSLRQRDDLLRNLVESESMACSQHR